MANPHSLSIDAVGTVEIDKEIFNMKLSSYILTIMFILFLSGCYRTSEYSGGGQLIDNGIFAAKDRYILDLGKIDLNVSGNYVFNIIGLPPDEEFVVGFELESEQKIDIFSTLPNNADILVKLTENKDVTIFEARSNLSDWVWSTGSLYPNSAFIYMSGENKTYFKSNKATNYKLTISIIKPNQITIPTKKRWPRLFEQQNTIYK